MTIPNNFLNSWPTGIDEDQGKAMQALWQAQVEWSAFIGALPLVQQQPAQPEPQPEELDSSL